MHIRTLVLVCLASTLLAPRAEAQFQASNPAPGENYNVELGLMWWTPQPGIIILSGSLAPLSSAGVDFVREFNLENERFVEFRSVLKGGKHKLRISRVPFEYEASAVLQRTVEFAGQTFDVNAEATADVSWDMWRFGYEYDFVAGDAGYVGFIAEVKQNNVTADLRRYVGFIAEVKQNNVTADLRLASASESGASLTDINITAPQLGVTGRVYPHKNVSITAEFTGFKMPGWIRERFTDEEDFEANFKDFEIYGTVSITRFIGIQGGYRWLEADYVVDDESGNLEMKGLYFGGLFRF